MAGWAVGDGIAGPSRQAHAPGVTPSPAVSATRGLPPLFAQHQQASPSGRNIARLDDTPGSLESPSGPDHRPDSRDGKDGKGSSKKKKLKDGGPAANGSPSADDKEKRTKTGRACDACVSQARRSRSAPGAGDLTSVAREEDPV